MSTAGGPPLRAVSPARLSSTPKPAFQRTGATPQSAQTELDVCAAVAGAKQGDKESFCFLYHHFADLVYTHAWRLLRDEYGAEDVTQQVFTKLLSSIAQYEERGLSFAAWILRITHNLAIDQLRRRRETPCDDVFLASTPVDDAVLDRRSSLAAALRTVPQDQRNVVVLRHLVGLSPSEIADRMGRSEGSVHGLHHRGRRALRRALSDLDAAPSTSAA